jgi:streptomycin 6-kinase
MAEDQARLWLTRLPDQYRQLGHPFEPGLLHAALAATRNLTARPPRPVLLHGDFHRGNVLASTRAGWLAIDPSPLTGDPEYDIADLTADFLDEHVGQATASRELAAVLSGLSQAIPHLDLRRARDWMLAKRITLALDNIAAAGDGEWDVTFARLLLNQPGQ